MSHYSSCHLSSLPCPHPSQSPISFVCLSTFFRCIRHTPLFYLSSFPPSFFVLTLCLKPPHLSQCLHPQNSTSLPSSLPMFYPSILPSIHHPPQLSLSVSCSLVSLCCGLCLPSLSELLSLLSAPLARTKSSSAHGTTKDKGEIKGKSLSQKKKKRRKGGKIKKEGSNLEEKEGARNTSFLVNHDALSSVGYNNH